MVMAMMMNTCRHFIFCPAMPVTIEIRNKTRKTAMATMATIG
jgi:hypothetical protein